MRGLEVRNLNPRAAHPPFSAFLVKLKPHVRLPAVYHRKTSEFFFVLKGAARGIVDRKNSWFKRGSFAFLPPGCVHDLRAGKNGVEALAVFCPRMSTKKPDLVILRGARDKAQ